MPSDVERASAPPGSTRSGRSAAVTSRPPRAQSLWRALLLLALLTGIAVRVWAVVNPSSQVNSDNAVEGLMAVRLLRDGSFPAFFWGQAYGGTVELLPVAGVMWLVGERAVAIQLVQFGEGLLQAVIVWRIGLRILGPQRAALAGMLVWVFPAAFILVQGTLYLFYESTAVCGLLVMLLALRVVDRPSDRLSWAAMGLAGGVAFWSSPLSLLFLVPVSLWLLARLRTRARYAWPAVLPAVLGATPWLVANVRSGWTSLMPAVVPDGPADRLRVMVRAGLPTALGLRVPLSEAWIFPGARWVYVLVCLALLAALLPAVRRSSLHLVVLLTFPFIFAATPVVSALDNGRYYIYLAGPLALALSSLTPTLVARAGVLTACTVLTVIGVSRAPGTQVPLPPTGPVTALLASRGVSHAYGGYWTAYKLTWESSESVICTPMYFVRDRQYDQAVAASDRVALIYNIMPGEPVKAAGMRAFLVRTGVRFEEVKAGGYTVFLPEQAIHREQIPPEGFAIP